MQSSEVLSADSLSQAKDATVTQKEISTSNLTKYFSQKKKTIR